MSQNIVNLLGAGSGLDTQALVQSLVEVEQSAPQERIDSKRELVETQISDYGLLTSALSVLQDAANLLGDSDTFNSKSAAFPESTAFVPVSLDPEAQVGDYSFTISQLAQAQSLSTDTTFQDPSDAVGLGALTFNFGQWDVVEPPADPTTFIEDTAATATTITIDASNNSLSGLASAINDADFGVQASVVNDGTGYRLVMRAESGLNNQLQITAADTDGNNTDASGLSSFAFNASAFQMTQNQVGQDSAFTINGLAVTRESNTIDDAIDGFEYTLSNITAESETINISIEEDKSGAETVVRDFVEAYNLFLETIEPLIGINSETDEYGSLYRDSLAKNMPSQIRQLLAADVDGLNSTFSALSTVGIRTELDGSISIDEDTFTSAVDDNYDLFKQLFIPQTSSTSDQITVNSFGDNTASGEYAVEITQTPAKGFLTGTDIDDNLIAGLAADVPTSAVLNGAAPTLLLSDLLTTSGEFNAVTSSVPLDLLTQGIGANDYDFSITVDGVNSAANISLPIVDYADNDAIATALQTAINNDANISGVTVTYDTDHFVFTSSSDGASSAVSLAAVGESADQLGISSGVVSNGSGGANDYDFSIAVDGTSSGTISLTPGNYDSFDTLATHIQEQINADASLTGVGASVAVTHNGSQFIITSNSTGVASTIASATAIGSQASTLGIAAGETSQGATTGGNTTAYDFTINIDGTTSGTVSLDTGSYNDLEEVAAHIESQINADDILAAAGARVDVSYDVDNDTFIIESRRYGSSSSVSITPIGTDAAELGLDTGTITAGIDVAGTINGLTAFGSGNVLLPALGESGESLALLIGENATTATVNFSRGMGESLSVLIDQFTSNSGTILLRETTLDGDIEDLDEDQASLDRRIEAFEDRLTAQFIAMEAIVRSLQDSQSFLESTLTNLLESYNN